MSLHQNIVLVHFFSEVDGNYPVKIKKSMLAKRIENHKLKHIALKYLGQKLHQSPSLSHGKSSKTEEHLRKIHENPWFPDTLEWLPIFPIVPGPEGLGLQGMQCPTAEGGVRP